MSDWTIFRMMQWIVFVPWILSQRAKAKICMNTQGMKQGEWHVLWKQVHGKTTWWSRCIELMMRFGLWGSKVLSLQGSENALVPTRLGWQGITWGKVLHALVLCKEQGIQGEFFWDASHLNDSCGAKNLDWELLWLDCRIWPWGHGRQNLGLFEKKLHLN